MTTVNILVYVFPLLLWYLYMKYKSTLFILFCKVFNSTLIIKVSMSLIFFHHVIYDWWVVFCYLDISYFNINITVWLVEQETWLCWYTAEYKSSPKHATIFPSSWSLPVLKKFNLRKHSFKNKKKEFIEGGSWKLAIYIQQTQERWRKKWDKAVMFLRASQVIQLLIQKKKKKK